MNLLLIMSVIIMLGLVFEHNLQGFTGAFILGITVLFVDYGCLALRTRLLQRTGTSLKLAAIVGVFYFRILNVAIFLAVGSWWLIPVARTFFHWMMITIPFWNLLAANVLLNRPVLKIERK